MQIRETVNLDIEKDADVIAWLQKQPNKSAAIRDALRAQFTRQTEYTLADVIHRLDDLQRSGVAVRASADDNGDEPVEAVLALGELGL